MTYKKDTWYRYQDGHWILVETDYTHIEGEIEDLQNKYADISVSVDGIQTTVGEITTAVKGLDNVTKKQQTQINQTAKAITLKADKDYVDKETGEVLEYAKSQFEVTADAITSEVTARKRADNTLNSKITQTAAAITSEVTAREEGEAELASRITQTATEIRSEVVDTAKGLQSEIVQNADKIALVVSSDGRVNSASIVTAINNDTSSIALNADKIDLEGAVTLSSLNSALKSTTVTNIEFFYMNSATQPAADNPDWATVIPARVENQFLWQKKVTTYLDSTITNEIVNYDHLKGQDGQDGHDGTSVAIKPSESDCTVIGDGYIDQNNGHLMVLVSLSPRTFEDAGEIKGPKGDTGEQGPQGNTPYIGANNNWWIDSVDTGIRAEGVDGEDGEDGQTPYIGQNGNWWIGNIDTGVAATGPAGEDGEDGISVVRFSYFYKLHNSSTVAPSTEISGWSEQIPVVTAAQIKSGYKYIWKRLFTLFSNATFTYGDPIYDSGLSQAVSGVAEIQVDVGSIKATVKIDNKTYACQYSDLPTASDLSTGDLWFCTQTVTIGDKTYTQGYWYRCIVEGGTATWELTTVNVQTILSTTEPSGQVYNEDDLWYNPTSDTWYRYTATTALTYEWVEVDNVDYLTFENRISTVEQTADSITATVAAQGDQISQVTQTADKVNWLVASGTSSSDFTLTDRAIQLATNKFEVKQDAYIIGTDWINVATFFAKGTNPWSQPVIQWRYNTLQIEVNYNQTGTFYIWKRNYSKDILYNNTKYYAWTTDSTVLPDWKTILTITPGSAGSFGETLYWYPRSSSGYFIGDIIPNTNVTNTTAINSYCYTSSWNYPSISDPIYLDYNLTTSSDVVKYVSDGIILSADNDTKAVQASAFNLSASGLYGQNVILDDSGSDFKLDYGAALDNSINSTLKMNPSFYQDINGLSYSAQSAVYPLYSAGNTTIGPGLIYIKALESEILANGIKMDGKSICFTRADNGSATYNKAVELINTGTDIDFVLYNSQGQIEKTVSLRTIINALGL